MCLTLYGKISGACEISVMSKFSLINENREQSINGVKTIKGVNNAEKIFSLEYPSSYIANRENRIAKYSGFLPNDKLTILCDITIATDQLSVTSNEHGSNQQVLKCQLVDDIGASLGTKIRPRTKQQYSFEICKIKIDFLMPDHENTCLNMYSVCIIFSIHEKISKNEVLEISAKIG